VLKAASSCLCVASHPTIAAAVPVYNYLMNGLMDKLEDYRDTHTGSARYRPRMGNQG
jgi:hypothetical protein